MPGNEPAGYTRTIKDSGGNGNAPDQVTHGDSSLNTKNGIPVFNRTSLTNEALLVGNREKGEDLSGSNGDTPFIGEDPSGNAQRAKFNSAQEMLVSLEGAGVVVQNAGQSVALTKSSFVDVIAVGPADGTDLKVMINAEVKLSSFQPCLVQMVHIDDAGGAPVETVIDEWRINDNLPTFKDPIKNFEQDLTGNTGDQEFVLRFNQETGSGSNGFASASLSMLKIA